jgi:recombination protein RecA
MATDRADKPKRIRNRGKAAEKPTRTTKAAVDAELDAMLVQMNKRHGAGTVQRMSDDGLSIHIPGVIPTGSESLDSAIGRGGFPRGRIILLSADEGAGKTTLALHLCANVQRAGGYAVFIDAEYKLDKAYAAALGVDTDRLILSQPTSAEQAFDVIDDILEIQAKRVAAGGDDVPVLIIVDSISALPTEQELNDKDNPGSHARVFSKRLKMVNRQISKGSVCLVLISQHRVKIGVMFGDGKVTAGGGAPRFYCTVGIKMVPSKAVKSEGHLIGRDVKVEVWKNQVAPPFRQCELRIIFGKGIDYVHSLHSTLIEQGLATVSGSWTTFKEGTEDEMKWQGANGLRSHLIVAERRAKLIKAVRGRYDLPAVGE